MLQDAAILCSSLHSNLYTILTASPSTLGSTTQSIWSGFMVPALASLAPHALTAALRGHTVTHCDSSMSGLMMSAWAPHVSTVALQGCMDKIEVAVHHVLAGKLRYRQSQHVCNVFIHI